MQKNNIIIKLQDTVNMCTVTFIPVKEKIFITSNRDEKQWRSPALPPASYVLKTGTVLFPRDTNAGGTWFAMHENGNAVVFLNGGFVKHNPQPPYRKSRGLVLLDMIDSENPFQTFLTADFEQIEPFTAITWSDGHLFECRWDGKEKHHKAMAADRPHIWSSVTLYDETIVAKREQWFSEWLSKNPQPAQQDILLFHQFTGDGDSHNDLMMNRDGIVFTVSITSMESNGDHALLQYLDFKNQQNHSKELVLCNAMMAK